MAKAQAQEAQEFAVKPSVHFNLQGKGGVGKSFTSAILSQYFDHTGAPIKCIDTDPVQQSLVAYKALKAEHVDLLTEDGKINQRNFDAVMEKVLTNESCYVIDNGSSNFIPLQNYLIENNVMQMLADAGRETYIHCVMNGGESLEDTLRGFNAICKRTDRKNVVVWINEFFGPVAAEGKSFPEMKAFIEHQDKVRGIVRVVERNRDTFGQDIAQMTSKKLTYKEALESPEFSLMAKQRLKMVQKDLFDQLDAIGF